MGEHPHVFPSRHRGARGTVAVALAITLAMGMAEVVGGLLSNSLALLGDAAHMFTDSAALAIALATLALLHRPPKGSQTFGYHRAEVLGALINGLLLTAVGGYVLLRSWQRFLAPEPVQGPLMLAVAAAGLAVNGAALLLLHRSEAQGLGARAAFLHIASDAITSVATIVAGVLVWRYGLVLADPAIALFVVAFVFRGALGLLKDSGRILMEAAPPGMDAVAVQRAIDDVPGVAGVHDVHLWSLTSGVHAMSAHVEVRDMPLGEALRLKEHLKERLRAAGFEHIVLELDLQGQPPAAASRHAGPRARTHGHDHP